MTGLDAFPMPKEHPGHCDDCFTPKEWTFKFNSGDPKWFAFHECECAERKGEQRINEMIQRMKDRNEHHEA